MTNLWTTFSTDSSGSFTELSGNIIYNLNNLYNFNGNLIDTSSNFIIYELSNNPIQGNTTLKANNWKQLNLNTSLNPFQGYWLGGINTKLPEIFIDRLQLYNALYNWAWLNNPIPVANKYGPIENWDVGNVISMELVIPGGTSFNGNISNWNVENVTNMSSMFNNSTSFDQDLNEWNVGNVTHMDDMFNHATSFNGNISNWNVGNVIFMTSMFNNATSFNQDLNEWNVGNVTRMDGMFKGATSFTGNISNWNVGNVTNMSSMFNGATSFNGNISNWNVGNVTSMFAMFSNATSFNQDISNWDVGNVTDRGFDKMFEYVSFFTDMSNQIHSNGTPFNYFMSQRNTTISVSIRSYSLSNFPNSGTLLILSEEFIRRPDSDFNRIQNALSITSMDDLVNYSFTSSEDPTSRDILSVYEISNQTTGIVYYYNLSGAIASQDYFTSGGPYTLSFTRRT